MSEGQAANRSKRNGVLLEKTGKRSLIHVRPKPSQDLAGPQKRANAARSEVRRKVEHVFAAQKAQMGLFIRTIGIQRAKLKIGMANIA